MKLRSLFTLSLATVAFSCFTVGASAQEAAPAAATPEATASGEKAVSEKGKDPALKEKLRAVRKAVKDDTAATEARKASREASHAYRKAERAAMAEKDPEFAKAMEARRGPKSERKKGERPNKERWEKMKALRDSVQEVPAVKEAAAKRDTARQAHKDAVKAAITKADSTLSPELVEKMADRMSKPDRRGRHGKRGHHKRGFHKKGEHHKKQAEQAAPEAAAETPAAPSAE